MPTQSFDVRVHVTGLCSWTYDDQQRAVHVLMPRSDGAHGGNGHGGTGHGGTGHDGMRHFARLLYDAAYERADARQLSRERRCVSLDGHAVRFARALSNDFDGTLCAELVNLNAAFPEPTVRLPRRLVAGPLDASKLLARVTFEAGAYTDCALNHLVTVGQVTNVPFSTNIEWTIRGVAGATLDGLGVPGLPPLHPIGEVIVLRIIHAPKAEILAVGDPIGPLVSPIDHFPMYYQLFDDFPHPDARLTLGPPHKMQGQLCAFPASDDDGGHAHAQARATAAVGDGAPHAPGGAMPNPPGGNPPGGPFAGPPLAGATCGGICCALLDP
jgi:hypothetical protein